MGAKKKPNSYQFITDSNLQIFKLKTFSLLWGIPNAVLQRADAPLPGSWNTVPGATSPFDLSGFGNADFFRLQPAGP